MGELLGCDGCQLDCGVVWYGANRLKRVPVVLQNVMLYVIRARLFNEAKIIPGGLSFKSWTKSTYYTTITFILNISKKAILSCYEIIVSV